MCEEFKMGDLVRVTRMPTEVEANDPRLMWRKSKECAINERKVCEILAIYEYPDNANMALVATENATGEPVNWLFAITQLELVGADRAIEAVPPIIAARLAEEDLRLQNIADGRAFRKWLMGSDQT